MNHRCPLQRIYYTCTMKSCFPATGLLSLSIAYLSTHAVAVCRNTGRSRLYCLDISAIRPLSGLASARSNILYGGILHNIRTIRGEQKLTQTQDEWYGCAPSLAWRYFVYQFPGTLWRCFQHIQAISTLVIDIQMVNYEEELNTWRLKVCCTYKLGSRLAWPARLSQSNWHALGHTLWLVWHN